MRPCRLSRSRSSSSEKSCPSCHRDRMWSSSQGVGHLMTDLTLLFWYGKCKARDTPGRMSKWYQIHYVPCRMFSLVLYSLKEHVFVTHGCSYASVWV